MADPEQNIRRLSFGGPEIVTTVQSNQVRHLIVRGRLQ